MKSSKKTTQILFLLIILLAVLLRIVFLDKVPPSLYTDEADQGYNAYSILLTGRDEHGIFLPVSLRSFGDFKPPLPTYLMIPFIYLFGLNEITVRLPSVFLGITSIILTFFLVKELFKDRNEATLLALLSSFFLTISPWHIFQSKIAMLVSISLFFLQAGIYLFIKGQKEGSKYLYLSSLSFVLSIYSYYGLRIVAPLILLVLFCFYRKNISFLFKEYLLSGIFGLLLLLPLILAFKNQPDVVFGRAKTVSVFYDQGVKLRQWELITQDGIGASPFISRLFHNNIYMYGRSIIQRFLSHFDLQYLLLTGDKAPPFQIPNMGIVYFADIIFILIGAIILFKEKYRLRSLIILWLIISIIPASLTFMTPSSNRTFNAVVPVVILVSLGLTHIFKSVKNKLVSSMVVSIIFAVSLKFFLYQYFISLPKNHADWWNYRMKETVDYVKEVENNYDNIVVFGSGMPYIYFLFYNKADPLKFQNEAIRPYVVDRFGFEHVEGFEKYIFSNDWQWKFIKKNLQKRTLYVVPIEQAAEDNDCIKEIKYPDGRIKFKIFRS